MTDLRREVSNLLGVVIPDDAWESTFAELEKTGRIQMKQVVQLLVMLLKRAEENELGAKG